jgi:hypothetical protein
LRIFPENPPKKSPKIGSGSSENSPENRSWRVGFHGSRVADHWVTVARPWVVRVAGSPLPTKTIGEQPPNAGNRVSGRRTGKIGIRALGSDGLRVGFWIRASGLRLGCCTRVTTRRKPLLEHRTSPKNRHGEPGLTRVLWFTASEDRVAGLAGRGSQTPGFVGFCVLGITGVDPPVASAGNRVTGVPWVLGPPGPLFPATLSLSASLPFSRSLLLSLSLSLYISSL